MNESHSKPLVSIVMAVYNGKNFIDRSLASCLSQSYRNIEVIVVDDGSTDGLKEYLNDKYLTDSRIRYIYQKNSERSEARNNGIRNSNGKYLQILDVDDTLSPDKIEWQVDYLERNSDSVLVYGAYEYINEVTQNKTKYFSKVGSIWFAKNYFLSKLLIGNFLPINSPLMRNDKEVFFDTKISYLEDWLYFLLILKKHKSFSAINTTCCQVYFHGKNSSSDAKKMTMNELAILNKLSSMSEFSECTNVIQYSTLAREFCLKRLGATSVLYALAKKFNPYVFYFLTKLLRDHLVR